MNSGLFATNAGQRLLPLVLAVSFLAFPASAWAATQCETDLADYRQKVAKTLADHMIDQQVYDAQQKQIVGIEAVCATGDDKRSRGMIMDSMISLSFGIDATYARSLKAQK